VFHIYHANRHASTPRPTKPWPNKPDVRPKDRPQFDIGREEGAREVGLDVSGRSRGQFWPTEYCQPTLTSGVNLGRLSGEVD
jgi:hypothetical protein